MRFLIDIGSAALELAYTACGRQGGFFEPYLNPWDYAAGLLLVCEAGGRGSDFEGNLPIDDAHYELIPAAEPQGNRAVPVVMDQIGGSVHRIQNPAAVAAYFR